MREYNRKLPRELKNQFTLQELDAERRFLNQVFIMKRLDRVSKQIKQVTNRPQDSPGGK